MYPYQQVSVLAPPLSLLINFLLINVYAILREFTKSNMYPYQHVSVLAPPLNLLILFLLINVYAILRE